MTPGDDGPRHGTVLVASTSAAAGGAADGQDAVPGWDGVIAVLREEVDRAHRAAASGAWDGTVWAAPPGDVPPTPPTPAQADELRRLAAELDLAIATVEDAIDGARRELADGDLRRTAARRYVANSAR